MTSLTGVSNIERMQNSYNFINACLDRMNEVIPDVIEKSNGSFQWHVLLRNERLAGQ